MLMRILVVCAHPDDAEISCCGTMAKYIRQGHQVAIMHACTGDKGDFVTPPDELAKIRVAEAVTAGKLLGATVECLNYSDAGVFYGEEVLGHFVDRIRNYEPDIIFTHSPNDYHLDHLAVSKLVTDATFLLSVPSYRPHSPYCSQIPQLYYIEPYGNFDFTPTDYVDITETLDVKLEMMSCHKSQLVWMKEHDNTDILDYIHTVAKFRGYQCGVRYAEAFTRKLMALRCAAGNYLP